MAAKRKVTRFWVSRDDDVTANVDVWLIKPHWDARIRRWSPKNIPSVLDDLCVEGIRKALGYVGPGECWEIEVVQ